MKWIDKDLENRMKRSQLKILNELELYFNNQYPTKNRLEAFSQFVFACNIIKIEIKKKEKK